MTGISNDAPKDNPHLIRSADGKAILWAGAIDDIWRMGKARGTGGPWKDSKVAAGENSDPYLMTAYDRKTLRLSSDADASITAEVDLSGDGNWVSYRTFAVKAGKRSSTRFPPLFPPIGSASAAIAKSPPPHNSIIGEPGMTDIIRWFVMNVRNS